MIEYEGEEKTPCQDRWVFVDGEFVDRVSNTVQEIHVGFPGKVVRITQGKSPWGEGTVDEVHLSTQGGR